MNNIIQPSRRVQYVLRDTTETQRLHLPINAPSRAHARPLVIIGIYAASGLVMFALIALAYNLL